MTATTAVQTKTKKREWAPRPTPETIDSANKLFDLAIKEKGLKNDADLCRLLELEPCVISRMRHGKVRVSSETIIRMHQRAGVSMEILLQARDGLL
jgi:plasmid maintenance system antidote protein VapI